MVGLHYVGWSSLCLGDHLHGPLQERECVHVCVCSMCVNCLRVQEACRPCDCAVVVQAQAVAIAPAVARDRLALLSSTSQQGPGDRCIDQYGVRTEPHRGEKIVIHKTTLTDSQMLDDTLSIDPCGPRIVPAPKYSLP